LDRYLSVDGMGLLKPILKGCGCCYKQHWSALEWATAVDCYGLCNDVSVSIKDGKMLTCRADIRESKRTLFVTFGWSLKLFHRQIYKSESSSHIYDGCAVVRSTLALVAMETSLMCVRQLNGGQKLAASRLHRTVFHPTHPIKRIFCSEPICFFIAVKTPWWWTN
jgi:hypothetical protein